MTNYEVTSGFVRRVNAGDITQLTWKVSRSPSRGKFCSRHSGLQGRHIQSHGGVEAHVHPGKYRYFSRAVVLDSHTQMESSTRFILKTKSLHFNTLCQKVNKNVKQELMRHIVVLSCPMCHADTSSYTLIGK